MMCRRHGSKPTLALWMLIGAADLAIIIAGIGLLATIVIAAALTAVVAAGAGFWLFARRSRVESEPIVAPIVARRRV
jgi:hypothetical protein